ncbi:ubiquitin-like modifier-activating enzyme atg7 [Selaginella moellendorffii]|uniref:ubiquitin-like modifier-activating enzyme atg7 n=1 Tax=Selaginella moellendorffii TaxID=88036 RepID=UPI000D1C5504|nr:ubiquitin-like modifier-activating enzyme atg7 [Selaginella moellendorffii]|eukprot:XP_024527431.1 ubiquitin-like modifier-activating enzyme atg7 [Selaginella moellendorffii]
MAPPGAPSSSPSSSSSSSSSASTATAGSGSGSATAPTQSRILKFVPWQSSVTADFWHGLANLKLDVLRLDRRPLQIQGFFAPCSHPRISKPLQLTYESLSLELGTESPASDRNRCPAPGTLYNTNTSDEFNSIDRDALMNEETAKVWDDICSGRAEEDSNLLNRFFVICYADLKEWRFKYWFSFPALQFTQAVKHTMFQPASDYFTAEESLRVVSACTAWRTSPLTTCLSFFLLHLSCDGVTVRPLSDWEKCQGSGKILLGFYDPSHLPTNPGWPVRNLLVLAAVRWGLKNVDILCWRELQGRTDLRHCFVTSATFEEFGENTNAVPKAAGWEPSARSVDLSSLMNPDMLAKSAADLNLKLMKWRSLPSLNLLLLSKTKCLLLGAGTLGCEVALRLLAWGIRDITFVDYGKVGYSNPLRQPLYQIKDCGRSKVEAAQEALKTKCVDVRAQGHQISIPMAGHSVSGNQVEETFDNFTKLQTLIEEHDVIFLLTDTRESRWLPTILCAAAEQSKIVINAALGFDSFVVMRHGEGPFNSTQDGRLGCYFCTDVVAPTDSTVNRTLDQQCTVSRPALAPIAGALAVEMAVVVMHHPLGPAAPADQAVSVTTSIDQPMGILPHQIRGFLAHYAQLVVSGIAFDGCTACSPKIVSEFKARGFAFILEALNSPNYLEDVAGLTDLLHATNSMSLDWDGEGDSDLGVPDMA